MTPFLEQWLHELSEKYRTGQFLSADDHHRLDVLRRDKWNEKQIAAANAEISFGAAWWKAMQTVRGNADWAFLDDDE